MGQLKAIIFDLGDVLISWEHPETMEITPRAVKRMQGSELWSEFERGTISEDECYDKLAESYESASPADLASAFNNTLKSTKFKPFLNDILSKLDDSSCNDFNDNVYIYAMSNMTKPHYEYMRSQFPELSTLFKEVFISAEVGMRKPELRFYKHVLKKLSSITDNPNEIIFVDDKIENVLAARSLGIHGIVYENDEELSRNLMNLFGDPVKRGMDYLKTHTSSFDSVTNVDVSIEDNYIELLILEAIGDIDLVRVKPHYGKWNFFSRKPELTTRSFPDDMDTTSLAINFFSPNKELIDPLLDEMLEYLDKDGIIAMYYDHTRMRTDAVVCANIINLFYKYGRGADLSVTLDWIRKVLLHRAYLDGTRYFIAPEIFLYYMSRLCKTACDDKAIQTTIKPLLVERIKERTGAQGDALALAMRIITCQAVGIEDRIDQDTLLSMQCEDGGWPLCWAYHYSVTRTFIGSRRLTTAFAVKAVSG